jgi:hypothetical protein
MAAGETRPRSPWSAIAAAWVLSLGFDFLLHGGLLARLYLSPSPFLLPLDTAFRRIPLGYLAFLVLTWALWWLFRRTGVRGAREGLRLGAFAGAITWGAFGAGLYSISTASIPLVLSWWIGQSIELALAGAVLGAASGGTPMKRIWGRVAIAVAIFVVATVVLQSMGFAPPMKR